jgi:hypothetical protein
LWWPWVGQRGSRSHWGEKRREEKASYCHVRNDSRGGAGRFGKQKYALVNAAKGRGRGTEKTEREERIGEWRRGNKIDMETGEDVTDGQVDVGSGAARGWVIRYRYKDRST